MENNLTHNTTPWLSYASWTWEYLRRNPDYIAYYRSLRNKGLEVKSVSAQVELITANQLYPTAKNFGLLFPADPQFNAGEVPVFWHPDVFKSVVRFHVVNPDSIDRKNMPIKLSKAPGLQTHFLDANGTYHIRFLERDFWFQIRCDDVNELSENNFIGLEFNRIQDREKRLKTFDEISGIYEGSVAENSGLHVPARLIHHQRSLLAYDIRSNGGTITDVISALKASGLLRQDPDKITDFVDTAKNATRRAKSYITGNYLQNLSKQ